MQRIRDTFRRRAYQSNSAKRDDRGGNLGGLEQQVKAEMSRHHKLHRRQLQQQLKQQKLNNSDGGGVSSQSSTPTHVPANQSQRSSSPQSDVGYSDSFWYSMIESDESEPRRTPPIHMVQESEFNFDPNHQPLQQTCLDMSAMNAERETNEGSFLFPPNTANKARSASFDESRSHRTESLLQYCDMLPSTGCSQNLNVPDSGRSTRSKSFDSCGSASNHLRNVAILPPPSGKGDNQNMITQTMALPITSAMYDITTPPSMVLCAEGNTSNINNNMNKMGRPSMMQQRSDSTTSTGSTMTFLDVPKWKLLIRRSSASQSNNNNINNNNSGTVSNSTDSSMMLINKDCAHCIFLNELNIEQQKLQQQQQQKLSPVNENNNTSPVHRSKSPSPDSLDECSSECSSYGPEQEDDDPPTVKELQATPTLNQAESSAAVIVKQSLERTESGGSGALEAMDEFDVDEFIEPLEGLPIVTLCPPEADSFNEMIGEDEDGGSGITVVSLEVPVVGVNSSKQSRSASVDSPYLLQVPKRDDIEVREGPPKARSKSVDIVLPTRPGGPYLLIPPRHPPTTTKKTVQGEIKIQAENGETRVLRSAPDWTESAILGDHIWVSTSASGSDLCYVGENKCTKTGPRLCCPACKVTAHTGCISILIDNMKFQCKPTFKDGVRQYREQTHVKHHWVHRRHEKGRCKHCGKSFQSKLSFGNKEIVAVSCSWCKSSYHNKEPCFSKSMLEENCDFDSYHRIVVPPSWIVKLPRKGSFKSSIRRTPRNKRLSSKKRSSNKSSKMAIAASSSHHSAYNASSTNASTEQLKCLLNVNSISVTTADDYYPPPPPTPAINSSSTAQQQKSMYTVSDSSTSSILSSVSSSVSLTPSPPPPPTPMAIPSLKTAVISDSTSFNSSSLINSMAPLNDLSDCSTVSSTNTNDQNNNISCLVNSAKSSIVYASTSPQANSKPRHRRHSHATVSSTATSGSSLSVSTNPSDSSQSVAAVNNRVEQYLQHVHRSFVIKPIPSANLRPLLVFINPKSGGNQGSKLMQKFQWHLNPRQVFDLSQGGPRLGLDLYKKVHNLRILACGGDGTAGWVLSAIDEIAIQPPPPISVLPLGTGNDLARAFGWGGSYTDEPIAKILCNIQDGQISQLDRWNLKVQPNTNAQIQLSLDENKGAKHDLPLNVVNNYFSIGVDAHIALSFHEAREAHPERFNSRLRNRMFYGQAGGKDLLQRKWKDLCNYVHLECDGKDYTGRLKELKVHSVLFLNIPSYGGGTRPWPTSSAPSSLHTPKTDDGYIEVIGLTTYQLPLLQAGGHGTIITQCSSARIITSRTIPMQVDGEPCRLLPSLINLELRNKANIIANTKSFEHKRQMPALEKITLKIKKLNLNDYETYHYDKDRLKENSISLGMITIEQNLELNIVRSKINELMKEKGLRRPSADLSPVVASSLAESLGTNDFVAIDFHQLATRNQSASVNSSSSLSNKFVSNDWCFVDSVTAERFFRIDRAQEDLYYVVDICHEDLFILDPQYDEKDDIGDLFASEEVIAKVVADVDETCSGRPEAANPTTMATDTTDYQEPMVNLTASIDQTTITSPTSFDLSSSSIEILGTTLSESFKNQSSEQDDDPEPYRRQMIKLDKFRPSDINCSSANENSDQNLLNPKITTSTSAVISPSKQNGSICLSPLPNIDSPPPKSPKRHQKMSPLANRHQLQNQLMLAAKNGDVSLLKHLHHKGINLMLIDEKGMSALHYAVLYDQEEAVSFLANAFTPDMIDLAEPQKNHTALHKAVIGAKRDICMVLVIRGARLDAKDCTGQSVEQLARSLGKHELIKTLLHVSQTCSRETAV